MTKRVFACVWAVLGLMALAAVPARADHVLRIGGPAIEGVFEKGKPSPYWDFYEDMAKSSPVQVELHMLPVKRFTRAFFQQEYDCMYMASEDEKYYRDNGKELSALLFTPVFNRLSMHAYTAKGVEAVHDLDDLEGKTLAGDEGLHVSSIAQRRLSFAKSILYANTLDDAFALIASGRAQVVISYSIDAQQYFDRVGEQAYHADKKFVLMSLGEQFTCWPGNHGDEFVAYATERINELKASGEINSRYGFSSD
jgi:ABC-type amino acid transport substrate-binding protein